jgi:hypothetical protein
MTTGSRALYVETFIRADLDTVWLSTTSAPTSVLGFLFGYEGWFTCEFPPATDAPERLKPRRHERRL